MDNYIYLNKEDALILRLNNDEFLIHCHGVFASKRNEEFIFSTAIMEYLLQAKSKNQIKKAIQGLISYNLITELNNDVYLIHETKKKDRYCVLYKSEFEKLKSDGKLLRYFCFILSFINSKTHQWQISNSLIEKEFGITNKTAGAYNKRLIELGLLDVVTTKSESNRNNTNIFKRLTNKDNKHENEIINDKSPKAENTKITHNKLGSTEPNKDTQLQYTSLKEKVSKIINVNMNSIIISKELSNQIATFGEDAFLSAIRNHWCYTYKWIWNYPQLPDDGAKVSYLFKKLMMNNNIEGAYKQLQESKTVQYYPTHEIDQSVVDRIYNMAEPEINTENSRRDLSWVLERFSD